MVKIVPWGGIPLKEGVLSILFQGKFAVEILFKEGERLSKNMFIGCQGFLYKEGLYYWRIKRGTRTGFASVKEEEVDSLFPFGFFQFY